MRLWGGSPQASYKETSRYEHGILEAGQELRGREPIHRGMLHERPGVPALGHAPEFLPDAGGQALVILLQLVSFCYDI